MRNDQEPDDHSRLPRYPPHTLAPDPHQRELPLRPPCPTVRKLRADVCRVCNSVHLNAAERLACTMQAAQREQR